MRSAVTAFTVTENPVPLEPVTADPFIDTLEQSLRQLQSQPDLRNRQYSSAHSRTIDPSTTG